MLLLCVPAIEVGFVKNLNVHPLKLQQSPRHDEIRCQLIAVKDCLLSEA